jgi:uncharacterized protein
MPLQHSANDEARAEPFGFVCTRCMGCCYRSVIPADPYEIARLARNIGITTTEVADRFTVDGEGTILKHLDSGACVFLGSGGCSVHADRPLACRLFPLARSMSGDGHEGFERLNWHPLPKGEITNTGTIGTYLESQDAEPFIKAANDYYYWLNDAKDYFEGEQTLSLGAAPDPIAGRALLDMDLCISHHCASAGMTPPQDIEARTALHIKILYEYLAQLPKGSAQ